MTFFKSSREKKLWFYAILALIAIACTLFFGTPLADMLKNQDAQAALFLFGMFLIGVTVLVHGLWRSSGRLEIATWIGLAAIYLLLFLRLGHPERSHLIEYSVLTVLVHQALIERGRFTGHSKISGLLAFLIVLVIGTLDEFVQLFIPHRVFDPIDILFNGLATLLAILASVFLMWIRRKVNNKK